MSIESVYVQRLILDVQKQLFEASQSQCPTSTCKTAKHKLYSGSSFIFFSVCYRANFHPTVVSLLYNYRIDLC